MQENDDVEFGTLLIALGEALGEAISQPRIDAYFKILKSYDMAQVARAINEAGAGCKFFPKPVELIEMIEGSPDDNAARAWALVCEAVTKHGYYQSLFVEDYAIAFAISRTFEGWVEAANQLPKSGDPMHSSLFNRFKSAYQMARKSGERPDRYFAGYHEWQNKLNVATWDTADEAEGEPVYPQKVVVIAGGRVFETRLMFSRLTGALTGESRQKLIDGLAQPAHAIATALPPARMIAGDVDPAKLRAQIAAMSASRQMPKPEADESPIFEGMQ